MSELFSDFLAEQGIRKDETPLSTALDLAARGVRVLPLIGKRPDADLVPHAVSDASDDARVVIEWFRRRPTANVGIAIGVGALAGVRVLDTDPRHGGDLRVAELVAKHGALPQTLTVESGRRDGGSHRYMLLPPGDYREKICGADGGVEFLGLGKYVVGPTSIHPDTGHAYRVVSSPDVGIAAAPAWLVKLARRPVYAPAPRTQPTSVADVVRARRYLAKAEPAISGSGGHARTFVVACQMVRGFGLSEADAYALLSEWNQTCVPPWSERDLRRKVHEAAHASAMPDGFLRDAKRAS